MSPTQVLELVREQQIEFIDYRFMDFPGLWQHITVPAADLSEQSFVEGIGFDGSSIRGWQAINESDMLLVPVAHTAKVDPFCQFPTLSLICDIKDPQTKKEYSRDPRSIARKAEAYLKASRVADRACFGPEMEFFVFDSVSYDQSINRGSYQVDSVEGIWNRGRETPTNMGYQVGQRAGYFPLAPQDSLANVRSEMVQVMQAMGIAVQGHHHEVATGGQCEIDLKFDDLVAMADHCLYAKHVVRNVAARHGKVATFMPKPLFQDNGSGMHVHFSLWKNGRNLMGGRRYGGLSDIGLWAIGGLLRHAPALVALTNPTTNSFKRLVPGYEAPVNLVYSSRNRSAAIRIPMYQNNPETKRIEFRCPDSSCNPYLAFAAMLMAALDGVKKKVDPGSPMDKDLYDLEPEEYESILATPVDLDAALLALERDHDFLLEGGVFTEDVIHHWIRYKRQLDVNALRQRPHPYEFCMYFDI